VTLEEGHAVQKRPEIWAMAGEERQQLGRCLAGLVLSVRVRTCARCACCACCLQPTCEW